MKLQVKVIAGASREKIVEDGNRLKVYVRAQREKGKANERVVQLLSEKLDVAKQSIRIIRGETSSLKLIEVNGKHE